jgi:hypothetical protein
MRGSRKELIRRRVSRDRGTALVLVIVMSVVLTGLVMSLAWAAGVQSQVTANLIKYDMAFYAAEAGAQRGAWYIKNNKMATQPLTGTINGATYSATWIAGSGTTQRVISVGSYGTAQNTILVSVTPPAASVAAALTVGNNFTLKNMDIIGDLIVGGNIDFQPGAASVTGNVNYGGAKSGSGSVSGTVTAGAFNGIDWTALQASLASKSGVTGVAGSGITYDFNSLSGANKVLYVNGDVTNPVFIGSGTLYVNGTVSVDGSTSTDSANPINIVATGDITTSNNISYYGALYTKANWNRGKIALTGSIYVEGMDQSNNGKSSITFTGTPWFDTRKAGGGSGASTTTFTGFAGPQP